MALIFDPLLLHGVSHAFTCPETNMQEGTRYYGIPNPAILFIDTENTVRAQLMEEGYQNRPAVDLVISTAAGL